MLLAGAIKICKFKTKLLEWVKKARWETFEQGVTFAQNKNIYNMNYKKM